MTDNLNIEIKFNGITLFSANYDHMGYTLLALDIVSKALKAYNKKCFSQYSACNMALKMLRNTGAEFSEEEAIAYNGFSNDEKEDEVKQNPENKRLIYFSNKSIEKNRLLDGSRVVFDLSSEIINFYCINQIGSEEDIKEYCKNMHIKGCLDKENYKMINHNFNNIHFIEFDYLYYEFYQAWKSCDGFKGFKFRDFSNGNLIYFLPKW